jgi:hypothetical protein
MKLSSSLELGRADLRLTTDALVQHRFGYLQIVAALVGGRR